MNEPGNHLLGQFDVVDVFLETSYVLTGPYWLPAHFVGNLGSFVPKSPEGTRFPKAQLLISFSLVPHDLEAKPRIRIVPCINY